MRNYVIVAAAAVLLGGCVSNDGAVSGSASAGMVSGKTRLAHERSYYYQPQTEKVVAGCMPGRLLAVLGHIREKTGVKPVLTSGHRTRGRKGSMHRTCLAADIRVPGVSDSRVIQVARTAPGIGGIGRYCNGIVHVDVGPRREWNHCGGKGRKPRSASRRG